MKKIEFLGVLLLIGLPILLRFWQVSRFFVFGLDEEYQALLAWEQVKNFHITFIGVSASDIGIYLGSGLTYVGWILLRISRGDPVIFGYFASLIGSMTIISLYYITSKIYNKHIALLATLLYGFSALTISYDRRYWPLAIPLVALWYLYSLVRIKKDSRFVILASVLAGLSFHLHLSLILFIPIFIFILVKNHKIIPLRIWFISGICFFVLISPLIIFDFIHSFSNIHAVLKAITLSGSSSSQTSTLFLRLNQLILTVARFIYMNSSMQGVIFQKIVGVGILFSILGILYNRQEFPTHIIKVFFALFFILFILFSGPLQEYHFEILFPFLAISIALGISYVPRKIGYLLIGLFLTTNIVSFTKWSDAEGLQAKKDLVKKTVPYLNSKSYYLGTGPNYIYFGGWRYLFKSYGFTPSKSAADPIFGWIYPDEITKKEPIFTVTVMSKNQPNPQEYLKIFTNGTLKTVISERRTTTAGSNKTTP